MEIKGKVVHKLALEIGTAKATGNDWQKQVFVIETDGEYAKKVAFDCMGKTIEYVEKLKAGDMVTVSFDVKSREYNGKWYSNINAWKIVVDAPTVVAAPVKVDPLAESQSQLPESNGQLPF